MFYLPNMSFKNIFVKVKFYIKKNQQILKYFKTETNADFFLKCKLFPYQFIISIKRETIGDNYGIYIRV